MLRHWYDWVVLILLITALLAVFRAFIGYIFYTKAILHELQAIRKLWERE